MTIKNWHLTSTLTLDDLIWFHKLKINVSFSKHEYGTAYDISYGLAHIDQTLLTTSSEKQELLLKIKYGNSLQLLDVSFT